MALKDPPCACGVAGAGAGPPPLSIVMPVRSFAADVDYVGRPRPASAGGAMAAEGLHKVIGSWPGAP